MHLLGVVGLLPRLPTLLVLRLPLPKLRRLGLPSSVLRRLRLTWLTRLVRRLPRPLLRLTRLVLRLAVLRLARLVLRLPVRRLPTASVARLLPLRLPTTGMAGLLPLRSGVRVVWRLAALRSACGTRVVPTGWRIGVVGHMTPHVSGGVTTGPKQANAPAAKTLTRQIPIRLQPDLPARSWPR